MYKCFLKNVNISKKNDNFVQFFLHPDMENVLKRYFGYDSFETDFIETYLKGNTEASDTEFESAIKRCESEHSSNSNIPSDIIDARSGEAAP